MYYCFGDYLLDLEIRKLYLNDAVVSDDGKTIQLLQTLCESYPEVVDKQVLIDALWPDQVVTDWSLSRLVSDTRQLLGDSGKDQGSIKTVRGRGFRLNKEVQKLEEKSTRPTVSQIKKPLRLKQLAVIASFAVIAISLLTLFKPNKLEAIADLPYRVAILPVSGSENEPLDEWLKYGIMSMMVEQLGQYKAINTIPVAEIINALSGLGDGFSAQNIGKDQFDSLCSQVGCSHLVVLKYELADENQQGLSYQIINKNFSTPIKEFIQPEVLETAGMMLDHLATDLLPIETERLSLKETFSNDNKANRDYGIGVHELHSGDLKAARTYLELALKRQPEFFWAKAFIAEIDYRTGNLESVQKTIEKLTLVADLPAQTYFLKHLYSNVLYSLDRLEDSMLVTKELLKNKHLENNFLLQGAELMNIGTSYQALNKPEEAVSYLDQAMDSYEHAKFNPGVGKVHYNLANVYMQTNRLDQALNHYQQSREIFKRCSMTGYALLSKHRIATVSFLLGKPQNAEAELENLVIEYEKYGDKEGVILALMDLAIHSYQTGQYKEAAVRLEPLLEKLQANEFLFYKNQTLGVATRTYLSLGDVKTAESHFSMINENEHVDYRAGFILMPSYLKFAKGNFKGAVETALEVKNTIGSHWTEIHQSKLEIMEESMKLGLAQPIVY